MNRIELKENWTLSQIQGDQTQGRSFKIGEMPKQVHDVLIEEGVIEDPNIKGINHDQWVGESDWRYETAFSLEDTEGSFHLYMEGLDTFAEIYLNGEWIGESKSVYMPCRIEDVRGLKAGENRLRLDFRSSLRMTKEIELPEEYGEYVPDFCKARVFRSGFHGFSGPLPDLVRAGVYGKIWLCQVKENGFKDVSVTASLNETLTEGTVTAKIRYEREVSEVSKLHYIVRDRHGNAVSEGVVSGECKSASEEAYRLEIVVKEPELWWPRSHGEANLYQVELELTEEGRVLDTCSKMIGFRKIEHKGNLEFYINGKPLRLWGVNLAHIDPVSGCYHRDRMNHLLFMTELANCNSLRVWGESEVLPEEFYEECDRRGILVWQDFYIGYNMYNIESDMMKLYEEEAVWLVNERKHHPCILLWCGGNEVLLSRDYQFPGVDCYGEVIFRELYPAVCRRLDPERYYHMNCPSGGEFSNDPRCGDSHGYTHQWYVPGVRYPVFLSENARFSAPALRTMKRMMTAEELWPSGYTGQNTKRDRMPWPDTWEARCCGETGQRLGPVEHYYDADSAEALIYNLGAAYCEYIKKDVERVRRGRPDHEAGKERRTRGHFLWKLNNCSNLISYGAIDYFGDPQMVYYALKRAYEPLQASFSVGDRIAFWIVNDTAGRTAGSARIRLFDIAKNSVTDEMRVSFEAAADEAKLITYLDEFGQFKKENVLTAEVYNEAGEMIAWNLEYVDIERHLPFPEDCGIRAVWEDGELVITAKRFARCVELTGDEDGDEFGWIFEDNYFDLLPGMAKRVKIYGRHRKGRVMVKPYYDERGVAVEL